MTKKYIKFGRTFPIIILIIVMGAVIFSYYQRSYLFKDPERQKIKLLPENISDATQGFSFSQSDHGKTTFEFKAKSRLGFKDNKTLLESVAVKVFGKDGDRFDTITSDHCEYDQTKEEIVFFGNVVITFGPLDKTRNRSGDPTPIDLLTAVKVKRIKYAQKTGIANTEDPMEFVRGRIHGKSRGLAYDSKQGSIHLKAEVEIFLDPLNKEEPQVHLTCGSLLYPKGFDRVEMRSDVVIERSNDQLRADMVTAYLNKSDSSLIRIEAEGNVQSLSRDPKFLSQLNAQRISYIFGGRGRWLNKVIALGAVQSRSLDPEFKRDISAQRMEVILRPETNTIDKVWASGKVVGVIADKKTTSTRTPPLVSGSLQPGDRIIRSPDIMVYFKPDGTQMDRVDARGESVLEELPSQPEDDKKTLSALELTLSFEKDSNHVERFTADKQVKVDVIPEAGPVKRTNSDHLIALMDKQSGQINQLHQFGNFSYREEDRQASADDATYLTQDKIIKLRGNPQVRDSNSKTTADHIEMHQLQNLVKATGHVRTVFYNRDKGPQAGMFSPGSPVYASSDFMEAQTQNGIAKYWRKAKLWQEDQVLGAEIIYLYRSNKRLVAEQAVRSLFFLDKQEPSTQNRQRAPKEKVDRKPVAIQAEKMVYEDNEKEIHYEKRVRLNSTMGILKSNELDIFLASEGNQTTIQRMQAQGSVTIYQPDRTSYSDFAEYFRNEEKLVLTGGPPRVVDSERGSTSGARLTLHMNDGSMAVEGDPEIRSITRQHVAR